MGAVTAPSARSSAFDFQQEAARLGIEALRRLHVAHMPDSGHDYQPRCWDLGLEILGHTQRGTLASSSGQRSPQGSRPTSSLWKGVLLLAAATAGIAILSEVLTSSIEPLTQALHWNTVFVGLIFLPLIGGLPDYPNTVALALDKRIGIVLAASAAASVQVALLIAPLLVLFSLLTPKPLELAFSAIELAVLGLTAFLFSEITEDGELVWVEGLLFIVLYIMMGSTVFLFG